VRSLSKVYASTVINSLRGYAAVISEIVEEGVREEAIRTLSTPRLIRDLIYGTVDDLVFNWLALGSASPLDLAEPLCEMVIKAIRPNGEKDSGVLDPKAEKQMRILDVATRSFARNGYNQVSMAEVAKEAGVAEGTVYEYYQNKENLLISIPEGKLRELRDHISGKSAVIRLKRAIRDLFAFFNDNREFSTILVLNLRANKSFIHSRNYRIYNQIFNVLQEIIEQGQEEKVFAENIDFSLFQSLVLGTVDHIIIPWVIFNRSYNLMPVGEEACDLFINSIKA